MYRESAERLLQAASAKHREQLATELEQQSALVNQHADQVVRTFENIYAGKQENLRVFQLLALLVGMTLLGSGWWFIRKSIVGFILQLERAAHRLGEGELTETIHTGGALEVQVLGMTMEPMHTQLPFLSARTGTAGGAS